ncbi:MAG TPA: VTT domain-containing protein [Thermoanaerobaculia bacterium]|nr:VTT domain-containing protein [Thermoanaerobaculia bacterium]
MTHEPSERPRIPRRLVVRFVLLLLIVGGGFAALRWTPLADRLSEEAILATFEQLRESWWAPAALVASYVLLCPIGVPAAPMMVAGGVVFGTLQGWAWSFLGTVLAAAVTYLLGRLLGRDFVAHLMGRRLKRVERAIARRGFWSLVGARFMPLPFAVVNYGAALAGVPFGLYLATTALGLLPATLFFTYFSATLTKAAGPERSAVMVQLVAAAVLLLALSMAPNVWNAVRRRKRYREVMTSRATRRPNG